MYLKEIIEVSSGFRNVQNHVIFADDDLPGRKNRPGSGYDKTFTIEIPDEFECAMDTSGVTCLWRGDERIELCNMSKAKNWAEGFSTRGFYKFKVVK